MQIIRTPAPPIQIRTAMSLKKAIWLLPLLLALVFVGLIASWAEVNDERERQNFQNTLSSDAQSVEAQLAARQDFERVKLQSVASRLGMLRNPNDDALKSLPEVVAGLDRLWNRLVWIDDNYRVVARAERESHESSDSKDSLRIELAGQADHFVAPVSLAGERHGGQLIARYEITDLLKSTDLAWLNDRYQVEFLSNLKEVIATTRNSSKPPKGVPFEKSLVTFKDTTLRLTPYESPASWKNNGRTLALLLGLIVLGSGATELLRREIERVATEVSWRQSMEDSALVGLRARDPDGRILYVNKTLCDMVGYSREELVGLVPPLPFWPKRAIADLMARNENTLAGQSPDEGFETRWEHRDGHSIDVMIFESPLVNSKGIQFGWMGSIVDISQRKALEERARQDLETIAHQARLNEMGSIAAELAHEINQPLTAIASYTAGLGIAMRKRVPDEIQLHQALDAVLRNTQRAGDIISWIRRQTSRANPVRESCDVNLIAAEHLEQRIPQIGRLNIIVQKELAPNLPLVMVDRVEIEQVIANLVRNAADALAEQGGERTIWLQTQATMDVSGKEFVEVVVRDNGPGLHGRTIDMLCANFYTTKIEGMGLGLGICKGFVEAHGGTLSALDAEEGGAEFRFTLPIDRNIHMERSI